MKFGVVVFPGSNCDHDCYHVVRHVLGQPCEFVWHRECSLKGIDCVILPGGFSYGDYLRCGAIAKFSPIVEEVVKFGKRGGPIIGICNGFQILLEAGMLYGAMTRNKSLKFICDDMNLRAEGRRSAFTGLYSGGEVLRMPIAHAEGNYYAPPDTLKHLEDGEMIAFRYCGPAGEISDEFNPNGAADNIAGIINEKGNVLGMMPHPERCSELELGNTDGRRIFESAVEFLN